LVLWQSNGETYGVYLMQSIKVFAYICFGLAAGLLGQTVSSETIKLEGSPLTFDIGYGIIVNEGSSLQREALIVQDKRLPVRIVGFEVETALEERNWEYQIEYSVELDAAISAIELRFIPFDIWGDKETPLSATTIEDINEGSWSGDGKWRLSETDAVQHYAMIGYVAQIKTASGKIIKANPDLVVDAAKDFSDDFSKSDLLVAE
jgi:hypothetical protein